MVIQRSETVQNKTQSTNVERARLRVALDGRSRCDRSTISYRGYEFSRPDWLRRHGGKTTFRILNREGTHVENLYPLRFHSPEAALEFVDALIDEDPGSMAEWMKHPLAKLTCAQNGVRA
jgi:hypothetical protein